MKEKIITGLVLVFLLTGFVTAEFKEWKPPECEVRTDEIGRQICCYVYIENTGPVLDSILVEMQVRPPGMQPLVLISHGLCDENTPENTYVHWMNMGAGPQNRMGSMLCTENDDVFVDMGSNELDIYLISVDKCWDTPPQGNVKLPPYGAGKFIGTMDSDGNLEEPVDVWLYVIGGGVIIMGLIWFSKR